MPKTKPEPFDSLIAPALGRLFRTAYRLCGNAPDAEDLVQETCVLACENLAALTGVDYPERWLLRVLYNRFVDGARRRERSPVVPLTPEAEAVSIACHEPGPESLAEQAEGERAFHRAWAKLQATQCALLSLRAEGYGLAEIEAITGIAREVLRARLHRARLSLARHLKDQRDEAEILARLGSSQ